MAFANCLSAGIGVSTSCTSSRSTPVLATSRSRSRLRSGAVQDSSCDNASCVTSATQMKTATSESATVIDMVLSDLDVDDASHDERADSLHDKRRNNNHPAEWVAKHDVDVPRRNDGQDCRDRHRQHTEYPTGHAAVGADRAYVPLQAESFADQGGQVVEHLSE